MTNNELHIIPATATAIAARLGYVLEFTEGDKLHAVYPADRNSYLPKLLKHRSRFGENTSWRVQTTSYGPVDTETLAKIIEGYKAASELVTYLELLLSETY